MCSEIKHSNDVHCPASLKLDRVPECQFLIRRIDLGDN